MSQSDRTESDTASLDTSPEHASVSRFRLLVLSGADAGASFVSSGERVVIGSDAPGADIVLHDKAVSRFHCEITIAGSEVLIRDLDSRNGTIVDGVSVIAGRLRSGQTLTLGRTQVRFDLGSERIDIPLSTRDSFGTMVGASHSMRAVFAVLEKAAPSDTTVLLEGETGTGKEEAAQSIHKMSARATGPFVVVDCGAIPPNLLESELFGHERGSFTGAVAARQGAFEAAAKGTIFLDEVGELGSDLQPKLLRALERREVKRVGATKYQPIDVRVVAATNRNLRTEINAGRFRADLYYRLAVVQVTLPTLRERVEDMPLLVGHILKELGAGESPELRTDEFVAKLARHPWQGNVRELRNYLERCLTLGAAPLTAPPPSDEQGGAGVDTSLPLKTARDQVVRAFEKRYLEEILSSHGDNVSAAARAAGIDRITFYRLLWRNGLR